MAAPYLIKLVRDRIEEVPSVGEQSFQFERIEGLDNYVTALRKKLAEEVTEYLLNPCPEELADIQEVCVALANHDLCVSPTRIETIRLEKRRERGGFGGRVGMFGAIRGEDSSAR
jgi:predicted house-cleaning noncanonical NTP pyrophosphatase (MazG superfamily)